MVVSYRTDHSPFDIDCRRGMPWRSASTCVLLFIYLFFTSEHTLISYCMKEETDKQTAIPCCSFSALPFAALHHPFNPTVSMKFCYCRSLLVSMLPE